MQPLEEVPLRQVPVFLNPGCQPLAGSLQLLARGTPHNAGYAMPIWPPEKLEAQNGEAPLHAGVKATKPSQVGFLWGHLEVEFLQPLGKHPVEPLSVILIAEGADPVIGIAAQQCLPPTVGLDDFVKPEVQGVVQIHLCEDGRHGAALGCPGLRVDDLSIRLQHSRLQPLADKLQKGPIINAYTQHVQQPGVVHMVEEALNVGLYQIAIPSVLQIEGEVADRIQRPASGSIAITTI